MEKLTLNKKPINQQRALWLNKDWAIKRRIQLEKERQEAEKTKAQKMLVKSVTRAIASPVNDIAKQPLKIPHKRDRWTTYVFCRGSNMCRNVREEVPDGQDDGWLGCPVDNCDWWFCKKATCQKQVKKDVFYERI
eukprot:gene1721-1880_t